MITISVHSAQYPKLNREIALPSVLVLTDPDIKTALEKAVRAEVARFTNLGCTVERFDSTTTFERIQNHATAWYASVIVQRFNQPEAVIRVILNRV